MLVIRFKLNIWIACSCSLLAGFKERVFIDGNACSNRNQPASVFLQKGSDIKETNCLDLWKPKRISPSSVLVDRHRCFMIWVDDFDNMHDLLYICCPLIWPFAVWAWPTIAPLYHIQDTQWEQIVEPGFQYP